MDCIPKGNLTHYPAVHLSGVFCSIRFRLVVPPKEFSQQDRLDPLVTDGIFLCFLLHWPPTHKPTSLLGKRRLNTLYSEAANTLK